MPKGRVPVRHCGGFFLEWAMPSAVEFFAALWEGADEGSGLFIDCRLIGGSAAPKDTKRSFAFPAEKSGFLSRAVEFTGKANVYFGVVLRNGRGGGKDDLGAMTALWAEVDFKETPYDQALAAIKAFPARPSIGVRSGGGFHLYWLLREPVVGVEAIQKTKPLLRALCRAVSGDLQSAEPAWILRVPDTTNLKYNPPPVVAVTVWRPELRYNLSDFSFLPLEEPAPPAAPKTTTSGNGTHPVPANDLPDKMAEKLSGFLSEIWIPGYRHQISLFVAGLLAHAGYNEESANHLVTTAAANAKDEEAPERLRQVADTYRKFVTGETVAGGPTLQKMIQEQFPEAIRQKAQKIVEIVRSSVKKTDRSKEKLNFEVRQMVKFDSRPARYCLTLFHFPTEIECRVEAETTELLSLKMFKVNAMEQGNVVLSGNQIAWERELGRIKPDIQAAPEEASPNGALKHALEDFVMEKKENPQFGILRRFAGYDERNVFFRTEAFQRHLKDSGVKFDDGAHLSDFLRQNGFESRVTRVEDRVTRVWARPLEKQRPIEAERDLFPRNEPGSDG